MIDCWVMSTYVNEYNHEFSTNYAEEREWNSHKKIDLSTRDLIYYLQENNVSLSKVHCDARKLLYLNHIML